MWKFSPGLQEIRIRLLNCGVLTYRVQWWEQFLVLRKETVVLGNYSDLYQYNVYLLDG